MVFSKFLVGEKRARIGEKQKWSDTWSNRASPEPFWKSTGSSEHTIQGFAHSYALVIGINEYTNGIQPLATPVNDATRLAEILCEQHGYAVHLHVEEVTRSSLAELFGQTLPGLVKPDDRLLVYFAGHGVALAGDDGPAGYLIPQDARPDDPASFLPMIELQRWLTLLTCRHLLVILDCCFAGAFRWSSTRHLQPIPQVLHQERYPRFIRDSAWEALTSAAYDEKALDILNGDVLGVRDAINLDGQTHSPFALALFAALQGEGDVIPKGVGDGVITTPELYLYLRDYVETRAADVAHHQQTPGLWPLRREDKGEYVFLAPGYGELKLPPAPDLTKENNPYRGLEPYEQEHASLFFGRAELTQQLAATVRAQPLTLVLGASGTGKSSLVKAGLLPYLSTDAGNGAATAQATPSWRFLPPLRPGPNPVNALTHLLQTELALPARPLGDTAPGADSAALVRWMASWRQAHPDQILLLVVDQFEELITLCQEKVECDQFLQLLAAALDEHADRLRIVITLRTDFEPQFAQSPLMVHYAQGAARFIVPPMSQDELRQVIEGPAAVKVLYFDPPELVDLLINEVIQNPGALPLLSFTLSEMYIKYVESQSDNRALTMAHYTSLGGVIGSLRTRADEEYARLPDDAHRAIMQRVMLRMVAVEGGEFARRRVPLAELEYANVAENARVQTVLQRLVDARLVVRGLGDTDGDQQAETYVEPAHDALVRAWDKILVWQRDAQDYLPLQRRLTQAANEWERANPEAKTGLLWNNNPRLPQLQQVIMGDEPMGSRSTGFLTNVRRRLLPPLAHADRPTWLNLLETEFVEQSVLRRARVLQRIVGITAVVLLALTALSLFADLQRNAAQRSANAHATEVVVRTTAEAEAVSRSYARATQEAIAVAQRDTARSRELAVVAQSQIAVEPERALLIALEANTITRTFESEDVLRKAIRASPLRGALGGDAQTIQTVSFAHDGGRLFLAGANAGQAFGQILDFPALRMVQPLSPVAAQYIYDASFAPNDKHVLALDDQDLVHVWDSATGVELLSTPGVNAAWFADGARVAVLHADVEDTIEIWDLARRAISATIPAGADPLSCPCTLHVTPDDRQVVLTGWPASTLVQQQDIGSTMTRIWDVRDGTLVNQFTLNFLPSFSPDGRFMAYGVGENVVLRDLLDGRNVFTGTAHTGTVVQTAFSPNGRSLASASDDGTVRIWWLGGAERQTELAPISFLSETGVTAMAFSPDQALFATTDGTTVQIWNTQAMATPLLTIAAREDPVQALAFAPSGRYFVTVSRTGKLQVWSEDAGEEWAIFHPPQKFVSGFRAAHFAPDRDHVAVTADNTVRLFDVTQGAPLSTTLTLTGNVAGFTFSPAGAWLAAYSEKQVGWWEVSSGRRLGTVDIITGSITSAILSADGRAGAAIATVIPTKGGADFTPDRAIRILLWETAHGQLRRLAGDMPQYLSIDTFDFAPDSTDLLISGKTQLSEAAQPMLCACGMRQQATCALGWSSGRKPISAIHRTVCAWWWCAGMGSNCAAHKTANSKRRSTQGRQN